MAGFPMKNYFSQKFRSFLQNNSLAKYFHIPGGSSYGDGNPEGLTVETLINNIKDNKYDHIICMVGAGISTSAGIPDFRSPETGLFHQLEKYNLPFPEAVFDLRFFKMNPKPFFHLAKSLLPENFKPTPCHYFMRLIYDKNLMLRTYTQNIDSLERIAGIPEEKLVEAHGSFHTGHCINRECGKSYSLDWMKAIVMDENRENNVPCCEDCGSYVKPDIIFYGEQLPERFYSLHQMDFVNCDLLIIMGTSLTVQPFASLIHLVRSNVPRLIINKTKPEGIDRREFVTNRDVFIKSDTDEACYKLADQLGWRDQLDRLIDGDPK